MATNNDREILTQLERAKEEDPELAEVVDLQHDLLEAQLQVQVTIASPEYGAEEVQARFGRGVPLLRPQEMALDWDVFADLYRRVCRTAARHRSDLAAQFEGLMMLLADDPDGVKALVTTYMEAGHLGTWKEETKEEAELLAFVFNHALRPFLQAYADVLAPRVEEPLWRRGRCPVCGGEPDLAFLDDESGARHLVCSRCDSQWSYARTKCPFCDDDEPDKLSYYPSQDQKYRLYVCGDCRRYLKTIDLRRVGHQIFFPVERVTTVAMDMAAREEGYR